MERVLYVLEQAVWSWPLLLCILGAGLYLMLRLRFFPLRKLPAALAGIGRRGSGEGVSSFAALCTALSATIGTGNIVGVAAAISVGGPGALLWMELSALTGMALKYAEGALAVRFRRTLPDGTRTGGPFAYIEDGLGSRFRPLARAYALLGAAAALLGVGTFVQIGSMAEALRFFEVQSLRLPEPAQQASVTLLALLCAAATALLISGGIRRVSAACALLVPLMAGLYLIGCGWILLRHAASLPGALQSVLHGAFTPRAALGGAGGGLFCAIQIGVSRGLFSNEAGLGAASIAAAASDTDDPVHAGLVGMTATFFDTFLVCTLTGLVVLVLGAAEGGYSAVALAFSRGLPLPGWVGAGLVTLCLTLFSFTTVLGWNVYGVRCLDALSGGRAGARRVYQRLYVLAVLAAPAFPLSAVFRAANLCNGLMAVPNLIALVLLAGQVQTLTAQRSRQNTQKQHSRIVRSAN